MAAKSKEHSFRELIEGFSAQFEKIIARQVEQQVAVQVAAALAKHNLAGKLGKAAKLLDGRRGGRLCPVPGCGQPGAGPRNRWFCRDHSSKLSVAEQKSILERNKRLAAEGKLPTAVPAARITRLAPKERRARRALDMTCRVEGCLNRSRGPRVGFICDAHRAQLTPEEQKAARLSWNDRVKTKPVAAPAPVSAPPAVPTAVPPIVRKAETAEA
jgi:hypothetical protein